MISFITSRGNFSKGIKNGEWKYYYPTGELQRINYYTEEGYKEGTWTEYYKNGTVKSEQIWNNNKRDSQIAYFPHGKVKYLAHYFGGNIKYFEIYYRNGQLKFKGKNVVDSKIENLYSYDPNGEETKTRFISFGKLLWNEGLTAYL